MTAPRREVWLRCGELHPTLVGVRCERHLGHDMPHRKGAIEWR